MKGIVFDMLRDMVEENYGLDGWQAVLDGADSDGMFISTETYHDQALMDLVVSASNVTGIDNNDLVYAFGQYMVKQFYQRFPQFFDHDGLFPFLLSVDHLIHVEVRKLFPDAGVPHFEYHEQLPDRLTMVYQSPRKLCKLAEGLIDGSAKHFNQAYHLTHDVCMHKGDDCCHLLVTLQ